MIEYGERFKRELTPEVMLDAQREIYLGEGPLVGKAHVYFVDIEKGRLYALSRFSQNSERFDFGSRIGTVALAESGRLLVALERGIYLFDQHADCSNLSDSNSPALEFVCQPDTRCGKGGMRYNEGKPGPDGIFYVGSMYTKESDREAHPGAGKLWAVYPGGRCHEVLGRQDIPNGTAWAPFDSKLATLYHINTPEKTVRAYSHDLLHASIHPIQDIFKFDAERDGHPDGMTLTKEGFLLVALYNGGAVAIIDPIKRELVGKIKFPVPQITSVSMDGSTLYVTSAAQEYGPGDYAKYPVAGSLFRVDLEPYGLSEGETYQFADRTHRPYEPPMVPF